jgi:pimeloyl-ACP methyl ester carboxylesterase
MNRITIGCIVASILLAQSGPDVNGKWLGTLEAGSQKLRLALDIENGQGAMISLDQGAARLPIKKLDVSGASVKIDVGIATYDGTLSGQQISGTFHQSGMNFPLVLKRVDKIEEPRRPQNPQRPFPYAEEEVTFKGGEGVALAGTMTYPKTGAPFAAVLLLTGSGPQDRDEAIMGHRPFLVLSDYLTRLGLAVLRVDDRGMGKSSGDFSKATYEDKVADALAGVELLKNRKEIDGRRIGLLGHSEGGAIAELAASRSKDIAFIVMMAGPGVPGDQLMKQQGIDIVRANGGDDATVKKQVEMQAKIFQILREEKDPAVAEKRIRETLGAIPGAEQQARGAVSPTLRDLISYDPRPVLRQLSCPVLALDGALDLQVSAKQNLPAIAAALAESKSADWQVVQLPGLNHLFQTAKTGNVPEYSTIEETISPVALRTIGEWLQRVTARP